MNKTLKWVLPTVVAILAATILIRALTQLQKNPGRDEGEEEAEKAVKTPSHVSVQGGKTIITLDQATQTRMGVTVVTLQGTTIQEQLTAPAIVLAVQDLIDLRNSYVATRARLEKGRVQQDVSRKEYERLKVLYQDNQNVSQKDVESAEGGTRTAEADVRAADQEVGLQEALAQQRWGSVVTNWLVTGAQPFQRILDQQDRLVQATLPSGQVSRAPPIASLEIPGAQFLQASLVSPFPRVDPRIQGISFLYLARSRAGLVPGANLVAHLPVGRVIEGVTVPEPAIVWWQGTAWVYQQTAPQTFTRRAIPTDHPTESGFLVTKVFLPGEKIVTRGAQMLFSEELRFQIQPQE